MQTAAQISVVQGPAVIGSVLGSAQFVFASPSVSRACILILLYRVRLSEAKIEI